MISNEDIIRLQLVNGLGRKTISKILSYIENKNLRLNNFSDIVKLLKEMDIKRLKIDLEKIESNVSEILECCKKNKIKIIGIYDDDYPKRLNEIEDRPLILYVDGHEDLLHYNSNIAIVGSRNPSQEGYEISSIFAEKLTERALLHSQRLCFGMR